MRYFDLKGTRKQFISLCATAVLAAGAPAATLIGSTTYSGHTYSLWDSGTYDFPSHETWAASVSGRYLATITSSGENLAIAGLLSTYSIEKAGVGGYQYDLSGGPADGWGWVTGETWSFTAWYPGEPNDYSGVDEVVLEVYAGAYWNDEGASALTNYIVTEQAVPEPASLCVLGLGVLAIGRRRR